MPVHMNDYVDALARAHNGIVPLNEDQRKAVEHDYTRPLWIIAGPGTGKTHTLVWLLLKRILVDDVPTHRIVLTTFTRKAAAELESRLILNRQQLIDAGLRAAEAIDVTQITVGTLHSICSHILQDQRYDPTLRIRLLEDELTQEFFVRQSRNPLLKCDDLVFWQRFGIVRPDATFSPTQADRATGATKLFNRLTENSILAADLRATADPDFVRLADAYDAYVMALHETHRCDQAHLQAHFLNFLATPAGQRWLGSKDGSGLTVLVDEYQDTNPIQEQIYFHLAAHSGDLTVVGDDDQSLYRFRGATVEALIDFDMACQHYLTQKPVQVNLRENRRSHPDIVAWVNRFIDNHPKMKDRQIRVRAPGKRPLLSASDVSGDYPAVMAIAETTNPKAAAKVVKVIQELRTHGMIRDYSQIALLSFSTRETSHAIGTFTNALRAANIPLYNPRSGVAHKDQLFRALLGALIEILDPDELPLPAKLPGSVEKYLQEVRDTYHDLVAAGAYADVKRYVDVSARAVRRAPYDPTKAYNYLVRSGGRRVTVSGLFYKLLAYDPFASGLNDAAANARLKALNLILAEYESLYDEGELRLERGADGVCAIHPWSRYNVYAVFVEGIHDKLNDPEDDDISIQPGMVNVMTIHQSKGLEFEVVFVLRPDKQPWPGDTHSMEDEFDRFVRRPTKPPYRRTRELRAAEDAIRLFFVAYSRAKRLLIISGNKIDEWSDVVGYDKHGSALDSRVALTRAGVHLL